MTSTQNAAFQAAIRENAERRQKEMNAIKMFIQFNLVELCREKTAFTDGEDFAEDAKLLEVADRLKVFVTASEALTQALRMVGDEATRHIARR